MDRLKYDFIVIITKCVQRQVPTTMLQQVPTYLVILVDGVIKIKGEKIYKGELKKLRYMNTLEALWKY